MFNLSDFLDALPLGVFLVAFFVIMYKWED